MRQRFSFIGLSEHRLIGFDDPEALKKPLIPEASDVKPEPEKKKDENEKQDDGLDKDLRELVEGGTKERVGKADVDAKVLKDNLDDTEKKKMKLTQAADVSPAVSMSIKTVDDKATKEAERHNKSADDAAEVTQELLTADLVSGNSKTSTATRMKTDKVPLTGVATAQVEAGTQADQGKAKEKADDLADKESAEKATGKGK